MCPAETAVTVNPTNLAGPPPSTSSLAMHSQLQSPPTPTRDSSKSNINAHQQPITTTTPTGDIPPPPFVNSIRQLRDFSSALSAFLRRYDDLHNHLNFINSSIDSKLPEHQFHTTNPNTNQSPLTRLSETSCDQIITAVTEQNPKESTNFFSNSEETATSKKKLEEIDVFNKHVEVHVLKEHAETDTLNKPEETVPETCYNQTVTDVTEAIVSEQIPNGTPTNCQRSNENTRTPESLQVSDVSMKPEDIDALKETEETVLEASCDRIMTDAVQAVVLEQIPSGVAANFQQSHEDVRAPESLEESDVSEKPEATVAEISCDQTMTDIAEANGSDENPTNCENSHENVTTPQCFEEIDVLKKPEVVDASTKPEVIDASEKHKVIDASKKPEVIDTSKKAKVIRTSKKAKVVDASKKPELIGTSKKPEVIDTSNKAKAIDTSKKPEQTDICKNPAETDTWKKHEDTGILNKAKEINVFRKPKETEKASKGHLVSELELSCKGMYSKQIKKLLITHYSEMRELRNEIAKALKLAKDPAELVLNCIGRFFKVSYSKGQPRIKQLGRMAVLILECFVMISSDIKVAKSDQEYAAQAAADWKNRMIREGGLRHTEEVDARGLLLLISGFGIQDHVFEIQDIMDLIKATNVKEISTALCRSVFLIPKIPEVIYLMVMNDLEIEAVDIAYTFGLGDMCHASSILTTYLHKKVKDIQNGSYFQMLEAMKQQLSDLKSVQQCLESHTIDPSMLLPDFKINEKIQNLQKEINGGILIQKRKSLENPVHQEAKRACFSPENMPRQQTPFDHYGMNPYNQSTQPNTSYITNYSPSSVYDAPAVPENIPGVVPNGVLKKPEEVDSIKKPEESVPDASCDQTKPVIAEAIGSEQSPNKMTNCIQSHENVRTPESLKEEEIDASEKPEEIHTLKKPEVTVPETSCDQTITDIAETVVLEQNPCRMSANCKQSHENVRPPESLKEVVVVKKPEEADTLKKTDEIDALKKTDKIDALKKTVETVPETSSDQGMTAVAEVIVSEQNPNRISANRRQSHENVRPPENLEEIDVSKKPEVTDRSKKPTGIDTFNKPKVISKKPKVVDTSKKPKVVDTSKKPKVGDTSKKTKVINASKKPEQTDISNKPKEIDIVKKPEQTDVCKNPSETDTSKKQEETGILKKAKESRKPEETEKTSKKRIISALEFLCKDMDSKAVKKHITKHYSEMSTLRNEIAKALKLAKDPAKLVLNSVGSFLVQSSIVYPKGPDQKLERIAAVLILECFLMISSDGIKIAKRDQEYAAEAAFDWRKRMIREGGLRLTEEVDARGLLLLISGFGIQYHVFKIQDIMDLIRAANVKGIATALRRSVFLIPEIPEVINLMVVNDLEIEAVDIAYIFGLEDKCNARSILATYLHKKVKDIRNGSYMQMLEAMKQQLYDLKSVKRCLKSHNIGLSMLLPDLKINEKIRTLEKEIYGGKLIQKRKSLENPVHQEAKRACFSPENMPRQQIPVDHYGMNPANVQPYGWDGLYDQHYSRHGQMYDPPPYGRPCWQGPPEPFLEAPDISPLGGFPGRRAPSSDLYNFAYLVEKDSRRIRSSGSNRA